MDLWTSGSGRAGLEAEADGHELGALMESEQVSSGASSATEEDSFDAVKWLLEKGYTPGRTVEGVTVWTPGSPLREATTSDPDPENQFDAPRIHDAPPTSCDETGSCIADTTKTTKAIESAEASGSSSSSPSNIDSPHSNPDVHPLMAFLDIFEEDTGLLETDKDG